MDADALTTLRTGAFFVATAVGCNVAIRLLHPLLVRYAMARPNHRSSHKAPTPQGGGIAVIGVALVGLIVAASGSAAPQDVPTVVAVVVGATALAVMGAVDDIRGVGALPRLILQVVSVGAVVATLSPDSRVIAFAPLWLERGLIVLAGVWLVNLVNFMDGIDWMTVAEGVPICAGLAAAGYIGALPELPATAAICLGGALVGFAPFNRPVAKLFLGDVGSVPMGLVLLWLLATLAAGGHFVAALLFPLYYLVDATHTLLRRLLARERVWEAHRTHHYQRATDRGFSVPAIITHVFVLNVALASLALATIVWPAGWVQVGCGVAGVAGVAVVLRKWSRGKR